MPSIRENLALSHGTNEPICAKSTESAQQRKYVLLPPIFAPVSTKNIVLSEMDCIHETISPQFKTEVRT